MRHHCLFATICFYLHLFGLDTSFAELFVFKTNGAKKLCGEEKVSTFFVLNFIGLEVELILRSFVQWSATKNIRGEVQKTIELRNYNVPKCWKKWHISKIATSMSRKFLSIF